MPLLRLTGAGHEAAVVALVPHVDDLPAIEPRGVRRTGDGAMRGARHGEHPVERIVLVLQGIGGQRVGVRPDGEPAVARHRTHGIALHLRRLAPRLIHPDGPPAPLSAGARGREEQVATIGRPPRCTALGTGRREPLRLTTGRLRHPDFAVPLVLRLAHRGDGEGHAIAVGRHRRRAHRGESIPVGELERMAGSRLLRDDGREGDERTGERDTKGGVHHEPRMVGTAGRQTAEYTRRNDGTVGSGHTNGPAIAR